MKEYYLIEVKEYENLKKNTGHDTNTDIGGVISSNSLVERNDRGDVSTIRNKNIQAENSLFNDQFTPETALKLFNHMNKMYEDRVRVEHNQDNIRDNKDQSNTSNQSNITEITEFDIEPLFNSFSPGIRMHAKQLMSHLQNKKLIRIDKYGNLIHISSGLQVSLATFLRTLTSQNFVISLKMKNILNAMNKYIPLKYIRNKKALVLFPTSIGGMLNRGKKTAITDLGQRDIYKPFAWVRY